MGRYVEILESLEVSYSGMEGHLWMCPSVDPFSGSFLFYGSLSKQLIKSINHQTVLVSNHDLPNIPKYLAI